MPASSQPDGVAALFIPSWIKCSSNPTNPSPDTHYTTVCEEPGGPEHHQLNNQQCAASGITTCQPQDESDQEQWKQWLYQMQLDADPEDEQAEGTGANSDGQTQHESGQGAVIIYDFGTCKLSVVIGPSCELINQKPGNATTGGSTRKVGGKLKHIKPGQPVKLRVLFDYSLLEVFTDTGDVLSTRVYRGHWEPGVQRQQGSQMSRKGSVNQSGDMEGIHPQHVKTGEWWLEGGENYQPTTGSEPATSDQGHNGYHTLRSAFTSLFNVLRHNNTKESSDRVQKSVKSGDASVRLIALKGSGLMAKDVSIYEMQSMWGHGELVPV